VPREQDPNPNHIDAAYYDALNPLPLSYTFDHMKNPGFKKNHDRDYVEDQGLALADSVIEDVKKK
jgi:hypothetical protein